jgi:curved DNA-binding protein CbpA
MGYAALPAPANAWWEILGVERAADPEMILSKYRKLVKTAHPDAGGSNEQFLRIQAAWEEMRKEKEIGA